MLKLQTIVVAADGGTDADIQEKVRSALAAHPQIVDFTLQGDPFAAPSCR